MKNASCFFPLLVILVLSSCQPVHSDQQVTTLVISTQTTLPTVIPTSQITSSPTQPITYQLTFTTTPRTEYYQSLVAIEVGCLEEDTPCFGEPEVLFEVPWVGRAGGPPIESFNWSPDGERIVMLDRHINAWGDVVITDWDRDNKINISKNFGPEGDPVWSPDGSHIIYSERTDSYEIILISIKPDGTDRVELLASANWGSPFQARYSPDGTRIVFQDFPLDGDFEASDQIFVADPDGSHLLQLSSTLTNHYHPSFSPDGNYVVFAREVDPLKATLDDTKLVLVRSDGSSEVALAPEMAGGQWQPAWAPAGDWIAFIQRDEQGERIFLIKADGSRLVEVPLDVTEIGQIAWRTLLESE